MDTQLALKKLREEIDVGMQAIKLSIDNPLMASISDGLFSPLEGTYERIIRQAKHQKKLGEKEMNYELEREKERVKSVVREYEELHPPVLESCPICLEDIHIHSSAAACAFFSCCGNWWCGECCANNVTDEKVSICPLCRAALPSNKELYNKRLLVCVERGLKWAQFQAGFKYESGEIGGHPNMKKAVQHYKLSAEQNHPPGLLALARLYSDGVPGIMKRSTMKAMGYLQKAADLGNFHAQTNIARMLYHFEQWGLDADYPKAVKYATLASHYATATDKTTAAQANSILGFLFLDGNHELYSSVNLATHYLGLAVKNGAASYDGLTEFKYSEALMQQNENLYSYYLTGFNAMPRVMFWLRKSLAAGQSAAKNVINNLESRERGKCSACNASEDEAAAGKKFLRCSRCKLYHYCSKECQMKAWNAGHKVDCKSVYC